MITERSSEFVAEVLFLLSESYIAFLREKKTCFIVSYLQVFIVFTKLARAAQPSDISFTPGPCSMTLMLPFELEFWLPPWPESWFPSQFTWPAYTSQGLKY